MGSPLWDYALRTYRTEGVEAACLALQDSYGVDINLLLYAAWLANLDRQLTGTHLIELETSVVDWRERVVKPLRALRRQLQGYAIASGVRDGVKSLELRAEQTQLDMMYAFYQQAGSLPGANQPLLENLELVARLARPENEGWAPALGKLVTMLPS